MNRSNLPINMNSSAPVGGCFAVFVFYAFLLLVGGGITSLVLTPTVNWWLEYAGKDPVFPHWIAFLCGLFPPIVPISIIGGIATIICSFFL